MSLNALMGAEIDKSLKHRSPLLEVIYCLMFHPWCQTCGKVAFGSKNKSLGPSREPKILLFVPFFVLSPYPSKCLCTTSHHNFSLVT